jgi:hypothetical protein
MKAQVRISADDPHVVTRAEAPQGAVDQQMAASVETEIVKVDSQQR